MIHIRSALSLTARARCRLGCAALAGLSLTASAKTCTWNSTTSSSGWKTAANWQENAVPEDGDDVILNHSSAFDMEDGLRLRSLTLVTPPDGGGIALNCGPAYKLSFQQEAGVTNIRFAAGNATQFQIALNVEVQLAGAVSVDVPYGGTVHFQRLVGDGASAGSLVCTGAGSVQFQADNTFTGGVDNRGGVLKTYAGSGFGTGTVSFGPVAQTNNTQYGTVYFMNDSSVTVPNAFDYRGAYIRSGYTVAATAFFVSTGDVTFEKDIAIHGARSDRSVFPKNVFRMLPRVDASQAAATYTFNGNLNNADDYNPDIYLGGGNGSSFVFNGKVAGNSAKAGASGKFGTSAGGTVAFNAAPQCPGVMKVNGATFRLNCENVVGTSWNSCVSLSGSDAAQNILDLGGHEQNFWHVTGAGSVRGAAGSRLVMRHNGNAKNGVGTLAWSLDGAASFKFASTDSGSNHTNDWSGGTCTSTGTVELARQQTVSAKSPLMDSRLNLTGSMSLPNIAEITVGPSCWLGIGADVTINPKARLTLADDGEQKAKIVIPAGKTVTVRALTLNGVERAPRRYTKATLPDNIVGDGELNVFVSSLKIIIR